MVLSVARAGTLLTSVVCMTIFVYNMVQPLGDSGDPYHWKVRDAHAGVMPQPLLPQTQRAAPEAWPPLMQAGAAARAPMDSNLSGLEGSTHHLDFSALSARERDDLTYGWQLCDNCDNTSSFHVRVHARPWSHEASFKNQNTKMISPYRLSLRAFRSVSTVQLIVQHP